MDKEQKPKYLEPCMVIKPFNFKVFPLLLHSCYTPQFQNIAILVMAF